MFEPAIAGTSGPRAPVPPGPDLGRARNPSVEVLGAFSGTVRGPAEAFIEAAYRRAFNGRPTRHYPILISIRNPDGAVLAAAGLRRAADEPLFLESYLDRPVEAVVSEAFDADVERSAILEIGGLASTAPAASMRLFRSVAAFAAGEGCDVAVATMTRQLRRKFDRLRIPLRTLAKADRERLGPAAADWGGYYERHPQVVAGALGPSLASFLDCQAADLEITA